MKCKQRKSKPCRNFQRRTQRGSFLNTYDFAYAGRDTINQVGKIAPDIIKKRNQGNKQGGSAEEKPNYEPGRQRSGERASQNP